jgi:hypothetical protein
MERAKKDWLLGRSTPLRQHVGTADESQIARECRPHVAG